MDELMAGGDERVRAALERLLQDPPAELVKMVHRECGDKSVTKEDVRTELMRLSDCHPSSPRPHPSCDAMAAYREIERYCLDLEPDAVRPQLWKPAVAISFLKGSRSFCDVSVFTGGMRIRLKHNAELTVHSATDLESAKPLIRQAFEAA
ncbi:MAG TPA: hypothetical protein VGL38_06935 [bacterium]|jgi:hypothetical protein